MKDGGSDTDHSDGGQDRQESGGGREEQQSGQGESHADRERIRLGVFVGIDADQRLEERGGDLERSRDHADLAEVEVIGSFEDRINRGDDGLHHVVEEMAEGDRGQDAEGGRFGVVGDAREGC